MVSPAVHVCPDFGAAGRAAPPAGILPTARLSPVVDEDGPVRKVLLFLALLAVPAPARAADAPEPTDLTTIGLEDLMQLEVTSVSRREEPLFRAASAIAVLTADDIARSGATNIPDLLRTVPGMNVAQINANTWAVSARGFGGQYANKMLVLVDGRTVYNPIFSGVYWDVLDVLLEDVQRIEIIRGPGATAWGANAVNGVINIITRPASAAPGLIAIAGGGTPVNAFGGLRYAGTAGRSADFRLFAKVQKVGRLKDVDGQEGHDGLDLGHLGGRLDWQVGPEDQVSVQGDVYDGTVEQRNMLPSMDPPYAMIVDHDGLVRGGNLLASWQHTFSTRSDLRVKAYFDRTRHESVHSAENVRTFDLDFQHRFALGRRHDFMWGGGHRATRLDIGASPHAEFVPPRRATRLENIFVQDAIEVLPNRLTLTLGSKLEHNDFTGIEVEPSGRAVWAVSPSHTVWGAVSRAVRTPGPVDENIDIILAAYPIGPGAVGVTRLLGTEMRSEIMKSLELGYRAQFHSRLSLDVAGFENRYDHLRVVEPGAPYFEGDPPPPHMVFPLYFANGAHGRTRGLESKVDWRPGPRFGLTASHSLIWMRLENDPGRSGDPDSEAGGTPTYQLVVHPRLAVARDLDLDVTWHHVDDLPSQGIPAYDRVDARLGWTPASGLELSAGVRNVFHDGDLEFSSASGTSLATTVRTGVFGKVMWKL
jgi:iron complex outermembrane recepter protein